MRLRARASLVSASMLPFVRRAKAACWIEEEQQLSKQPLKAKHIVISSHVEHCLTFPQGG